MKLIANKSDNHKNNWIKGKELGIELTIKWSEETLTSLKDQLISYCSLINYQIFFRGNMGSLVFFFGVVLALSSVSCTYISPYGGGIGGIQGAFIGGPQGMIGGYRYGMIGGRGYPYGGGYGGIGGYGGYGGIGGGYGGIGGGYGGIGGGYGGLGGYGGIGGGYGGIGGGYGGLGGYGGIGGGYGGKMNYY